MLACEIFNHPMTLTRSCLAIQKQFFFHQVSLGSKELFCASTQCWHLEEAKNLSLWRLAYKQKAFFRGCGAVKKLHVTNSLLTFYLHFSHPCKVTQSNCSCMAHSGANTGTQDGRHCCHPSGRCPGWGAEVLLGSWEAQLAQAGCSGQQCPTEELPPTSEKQELGLEYVLTFAASWGTSRGQWVLLQWALSWTHLARDFQHRSAKENKPQWNQINLILSCTAAV